MGAKKRVNEVESVVRQIVVDKLGVDPEQVTRESAFCNDLGADSLDTVEIVMTFEMRFNFEIPDEDAEKLETVGEAVDYIEKRLRKIKETP